MVGPYEIDDFAWTIGVVLERAGFPVISVGNASGGFLHSKSRISPAVSQIMREPRLGYFGARRTASRILDTRPDFVITVQSLHPTTVTLLAEAGVPTALWFPDHAANLAPFWMFSAPYSGLFFKEPALVRYLQNTTDLPVHYLPQSFCEAIHRPVEGEWAPEIAVVGNFHALRVSMLTRLVADGIPLRLYGGVPRNLPPQLLALHSKQYVRGADKSRIFRNSAAVLNALFPIEFEGMNKRIFEATASGGCVVTEYRPALLDLFECGEEVLCFQTYPEMLEILRDVIANPDAYEKLRERGLARARRDHTMHQRLRFLFGQLGFTFPDVPKYSFS